MLTDEFHFDRVRLEACYAYRSVPFYRKQFDAVGLDPKDLKSMEDVVRIPPTAKNDYRKHFPAGVLAKGFAPNGRGIRQRSSSGSMGDRSTTAEFGPITDCRTAFTFTAGPGIEEAFAKFRMLLFVPPACTDVECATPHTTMQQRMIGNGAALALSVYHDLLTTPKNLILQAITEIDEYKPALIYGAPAHVAFLVRQTAMEGYHLPKIPVITSFTSLSAVNRRQIREGFPAPLFVSETLAMSEFGFIGVECSHGNMHLNTRSFFFELRKQGRNANPGELGELTITTLDQGATPYIRYKTGDTFTLIGEPCPCGHPFPTVRMEGRCRQLLYRRGQVVATPKQIDDLVGPAPWITLYRMQQLEDDLFVFSFIPNEKFDPKCEIQLRDQLTTVLGSDAQLRMEKVNYLPATAGGKVFECESAIAEKMPNVGDAT